MTRLAIFVSGGGTNCENIINYFDGSTDVEVSLVLSSSPSAYALTRAQRHGIETVTVSRELFQDEAYMTSLLGSHAIDFIVLAGFLRRIPPYMVREWSGRMINLHPALLPKFGGVGMYGMHVHKAVKDAGESVTGITVHYVSEGMDEGAILAQYETQLTPDDTPDDIAAKIHILEMRYLPEVIDCLLSIRKVKIIAFDADDTLWDNEPLFRAAEKKWAGLLSRWGDEDTLSAKLYKVESDNMEDYGYGVKAFMLSMIQTAIEIAGPDATMISEIISIGRAILRNPATPLCGVKEALEELRSSGLFRMVLLTKGDPLDQKKKLQRSSLEGFFDSVKIVSDKDTGTYASLCKEEGISPEELLMVGNSFKSDIAPALENGSYAVYVPSKMLWEHEKMEEFKHPRLLKLHSLSLLARVMLQK